MLRVFGVIHRGFWHLVCSHVSVHHAYTSIKKAMSAVEPRFQVKTLLAYRRNGLRGEYLVLWERYSFSAGGSERDFRFFSLFFHF